MRVESHGDPDVADVDDNYEQATPCIYLRGSGCVPGAAPSSGGRGRARWLAAALAGGAAVLTLIGFEPEQLEWERLTSRAKANEVFSNRALHSRPGELTLYHTRDPARTSIYRPNAALVKDAFGGDDLFDIVHEEIISATTLDLALRELDLLPVEFLKLDTQGGELEILQGATRTLTGLFGVEVEVEFEELYEGQPLFPDIHGFLRSRGFRFMDFPRVFTLADVRFASRGIRGYRNAGDLVKAWAGKLRGPSGAWRGASQMLYADAVYLRPPKDYLGKSGGDLRAVVTGVFLASQLGYFEYASDLLEVGRRGGLLGGAVHRDLAGTIRSAARSRRALWGDLRRGLSRIARRVAHPGR